MPFMQYVIPAMAILASTTANASANEAQWGGPYIGAHAGYTSFKPDYSEPLDEDGLDRNTNPNAQGISGGVLAGYNVQAKGVVLGIEADFGLTGADAGPNATSDNDYSAFDLKWNGHLRARVGYPIGKTLIFAAGGLAVAHAQVDDVDAGWGEECDTYTGFTIGGGVEHAVGEKLTVRAEYLFDKYGKKNGSISGEYTYPYSVDPSTHTIRAAVAYRF